MASALSTRLTRSSAYICLSRRQRCLRIPRGPQNLLDQKRGILTENQIRLAKPQNIGILDILEERGFVHQVVGERKHLEERLADKTIGVYVGVDPTADSMHVGHLVPFMAMYWMYAFGYHACSVLGGVTSSFGDPSGRTTARDKKSIGEKTASVIAIKEQLKSLWENVTAQLQWKGHAPRLDIAKQLMNNSDWFDGSQIMLTISPGMGVGEMLRRSTVKQRLADGGEMSMGEFNYPLIQAWDWWHLYTNHNVQVQIGGSDQFGNILAGVNAIDYVRKQQPKQGQQGTEGEPDSERNKGPIGFTVPLITTPKGEKLGKSAGNAVWLDREKTTPFDLYQHFLRTHDDSVQQYLQLLTFLPLSTITALVSTHTENPRLRLPQHALAKEVVTLIHGPLTAEQAEKENRLVFQQQDPPQSHASSIQQPPEDDRDSEITPFHKTIKNLPAPTATLPLTLIKTTPLPKLLYHAGIVESTREGHHFCQTGGVYYATIDRSDGSIEWHQISAKHGPCPRDCAWLLIEPGGVILLRKGKTKRRVIAVVDDERFESVGGEFVGMKEWRERRSEGEERRGDSV